MSVTNKFFLFLFLSLPAGALAAGTSPENTVWENSWSEFQNLISAPVTGTCAGYAATAVWAGGLAIGIHNDQPWYDAVQSNRSPWQDRAMGPVTLLGDGFFHIGGYALLYKLGNDQDRAIAGRAVEGQILVAVISPAIKAIFTATRPGEDNTLRHWFTLNWGNASFASGHAMTAFCAAAILGDAYRAEWIAYPVATVVAYSRVYNSQHWPADVIAGAGIGFLIGQTVNALHAQQPGATDIHFGVDPFSNGGQIQVTWDF